MNYKLGYIADRTGVPSKAYQKEQLINYGVLENDIYEILDECLASLRELDDFVVYTTAILGRNKLNQTFVSLGAIPANGCYSLKTGVNYDVEGEGVRSLASAWDELEGVTKSQMAAVGRQLGGRKKGKLWEKRDEIEAQRNQGISWTELTEIYDTSEATLRRILK